MVKIDVDRLCLASIRGQDTPIFVYPEQIGLFERLADYWRYIYIDGTMFDGGDMVLSCRGVADNEFMVYFIGSDGEYGQDNGADRANAADGNKGDYVDNEFVLIGHYRDGSGEIRRFPSDFGIIIAADILEQLKEEEIYDRIEFVFYNDNFPIPLIMAHLC